MGEEDSGDSNRAIATANYGSQYAVKIAGIKGARILIRHEKLATFDMIDTKS